MPLSSSLSIRVRSALTGTGDLSTPRADLDRTYARDFSNGTGVNQANNAWSDVRSLGSGANEDIDLAGVLTNALGVVLTFTSVKKIVIIAAATNTVNLTVSRPAANGLPFLAAAGDAFVLKPGGMFVFVDPSAAGVPVTAGTGDLINIANGAAISSYDIIIEGTTA